MDMRYILILGMAFAGAFIGAIAAVAHLSNAEVD